MVATGIAPSVWWSQSPRDIATVVDILAEQNKKGTR